MIKENQFLLVCLFVLVRVETLFLHSSRDKTLREVSGEFLQKNTVPQEVLLETQFFLCWKDEIFLNISAGLLRNG